MDEHVGKGNVAERFETRPDHPVLPEADDLARRQVDVAGVVAGELGRLVRPAERRERPQRRGEPGIEDVGLTSELRRAALFACGRLVDCDGRVPVRAVPDRQLMAPPQLPRDAPVGCLFERRDREAVLRLRVEANATIAQRRDRGRSRLAHRTPPLQRDERLDARTTALARADRVPIRLALLDQPALLGPREHARTSLLLCQPGEISRLLAHAAVPADGHRLGKAVVTTDVEVERIVARRDLERTRSELAIDPLVCDDGDTPLRVRDDHLSPDRIAVAGIVRVDGDADVGEDRGRTDRRDGDAVRAVAVCERVADRDERVVHVLVHDLEIRDRRLVERAPVDDAVCAVDPPAVPEPDEERHDGADVRVVHREALSRVVERGPQAPVLAHDRAAGSLQPLPGAPDERLAPDVVTREPLLRERLLDHVLRRDACVVVPGLPEGVEPAHPVPANEHVLDRAVQRMADVEISGHVRRRDADHERRVTARAGARRVQPLVFPGLLPACLDALRLVERIHGEGV